jgi:hypothetical protein
MKYSVKTYLDEMDYLCKDWTNLVIVIYLFMELGWTQVHCYCCNLLAYCPNPG